MSLRTRALALCAAVSVALLAAASAHAAFTLPPPPSDVVSRAPCASVTVRPHVVSVGGSVTGRVGPGTGSCPIKHPTWSWVANGQKVASCAADSNRCTIRATRPTSGWRTVCIVGGAGSGSLTVCDYVYVLPAGIYGLSGTLSATNAARQHVADERVTLTGPGGRQTTVTDADGNYAFAVRAGRYTVTPSHRTTPARRVVAVRQDRTGVDFALGQILRLTGEITSRSAPHAGGQEFRLRFLRHGKEVGRTVGRLTCSGLAIHFFQCFGGPIQIADVAHDFYLARIEWQRVHPAGHATGELTDTPLPADPLEHPEPPVVGSIEVGASTDFGYALRKPFSVTITFF